MIIEGAFYKLPELLLSSSTSKRQYESTLTSYLAMSVLLELNARNIPEPVKYIHVEKPYPEVPGIKHPGRADLFVGLDGIDHPYRLGQYGMKRENWLEAKYFGRLKQATGNSTKTSNVGSIAVDLLRLSLFVQEERSSSRDNSRYFIAIFDEEPKNYLAFTRNSNTYPTREWVEKILTPGENRIAISLENEPLSFHRKFFQNENHEGRDLRMEFRTITKTFTPAEIVSDFLYWGYLIRIVDFEIFFSGETLTYTDASKEVWTEDQKILQQAMIKKYIKFTRPNSVEHE